jgi:hypothetical protein
MITGALNQADREKGKWLPSPAFKPMFGMLDDKIQPDVFEGIPMRKEKRRAAPADPYSKNIISAMMQGVPGILNYMNKAGIPSMQMVAKPSEDW